MNEEEKFSEEQLNAFIDGELDAEEKSRIFNEADHDLELEQRLCQQRKLGELVRHAYQNPPVPEGRPASRRRRSPLHRALVAGVFILVGIAGGLLAHQQLDRQMPAAFAEAPNNFILHVSRGDEKTMLAALRKARELIEDDSPNHPTRVEVVANERGLNLLRSDVTPFAAEIAALADERVVFYACSRAIQRLEERGVEVQLVPQANDDYTALDRVVMRMQEDWNYIKL
jgi:intracellular sulfur oxidation DsrE/DsrF family protein